MEIPNITTTRTFDLRPELLHVFYYNMSLIMNSLCNKNSVDNTILYKLENLIHDFVKQLDQKVVDIKEVVENTHKIAIFYFLSQDDGQIKPGFNSDFVVLFIEEIENFANQYIGLLEHKKTTFH